MFKSVCFYCLPNIYSELLGVVNLDLVRRRQAPQAGNTLFGEEAWIQQVKIVKMKGDETKALW